MASQEKQNNFAHGLGILVGIAGVFMGIGASEQDPEINLFIGTLLGFAIGYAGGRLAGEVLTIFFKVLIGLIGILIIYLRFSNIMEIVFA